MKILMISLDKKILDPSSAVAQRMIKYGEKDELFILIPHSEKKQIDLSNTVHVWSTGGNKRKQYSQLKKVGLELIKQKEIKFITVQDPSFIGNIGRWLKKKTGAQLEIQVHGDFFNSDYYKLLKDRIRYSWFGKKNLLYADRVRVVGERVKKSIIALGVQEEKIEIRPVLIGKDNKGQRERDLHKEFSEYEKIFLLMGRLEDIKNGGWLIDVMADIKEEYKKNFLLLIVGEGSEKQYWRNIVAYRHFENNVRFETWTTDPFMYYLNVDCVLFPSLSEGYGLVPMEANAAGTPVIMNNVGVANYELKPSEKVIILPVNDREAWKKAILSI